jgi:hypothetical protein
MQIYLPVAELSLNIFVLAGLGLAIGFLSACSVSAALHHDAVPDLPRRAGRVAVGTGRQPGGGLLRLQCGRALAARQHRSADGLSADRRWRVRSRWPASRCLAIPEDYGQLELFVSLSYVILLGVVGSLMLIESVQKLLHKHGAASVSMRRGGQHTWIEGLPLKQRFRHSQDLHQRDSPVCWAPSSAG